MDTLTLLYDNDSEIIAEYCSSNSQRAANALVRRHQKFVYSIAFRYLGQHEDAEDVAQEAFIKALDNLNRFKGDSNIRTWLYSITANLAKNHLRKKKIINFFTMNSEREDYELNSNTSSPLQELEIKEFTENFNKLLGKLPQKQRETFALRYFDGFTYEEISDMLGTSVGGLKANYYQAVQKITKELTGLKR